MSSKAKRRKLDRQQDHENPRMDDDHEFRLLPELLRVILIKAVLVQMYSKDQRQSDKTIFTNLASVAFPWWSLMKKYNLRKKVLHLSKVYFQRTKMRSTIIRNNRNFLKEVIHPDEIIYPLESCGCLTEDQVEFLTRLRNHKDKSHELLVMLQDFSPQKYSKFIRCLFLANQTPAALVLERGGEAVKVRINNGKETRTKEFEMELIERFQRMQKENLLILNDLLNASIEKRLNDVRILHAKQSKGIEIWFWCKTESSLNQLKCSSDEDIRGIIQRMYKRLIPTNSASIVPQFIQIDYTLTNEFAERLLSIRRVGEIEYRDLYLRRPRYDFSQIITSLEDKIYVAKSSEILVYKNKSPYESLKSIEIGVHGLPDTIASCSINKCLYISFPESRLVFKVEPQFENRVSKWLEMEKTYLPNISVTSIGDVLVLYVLPDLSREDDEREDNELVIFTPEGTLKRTIILKFRLGQIKSIHEIMPDVAVIYEKVSKSDLTRIVIMRLNEAGTILRDIAWQQEISSLSSFRYGDLLIGTFGYINDANNSFDQVHIWTLASKAEQNLLTTDESIYSIHFAADQKQLYILRPYRIDVYQLNYEDEDCGT